MRDFTEIIENAAKAHFAHTNGSGDYYSYKAGAEMMAAKSMVYTIDEIIDSREGICVYFNNQEEVNRVRGLMKKEPFKLGVDHNERLFVITQGGCTNGIDLCVALKFKKQIIYSDQIIS